MEEIKILLKNGKVINGVKGKRILDLIPTGEGLVARYNGKLVDLTTRLDENGIIEILDFEDDEAKKVFWHTASHIMAQAVKEIYPNYQLGIGHATENGFFYEFYTFDRPFTHEDLELIEKRMKEIIIKDVPIIREEITIEEAI